MARHLELFLLIVTTISSLVQCRAVEFHVTNKATSTPDGARFTDQIGIPYTEQLMNHSTAFIWKLFNETSVMDRKNVTNVTLFLEPLNIVAYTKIKTCQIHVNTEYIGNYSGDVRSEFTGILFHEMAHVWQWLPDQAADGLIEGIADFVRLRAGFGAANWVKPGQGNRWDQGYDVTALFLNYCDGLRPGFVAELNAKMRWGYSNEYFKDLLSKKVEELWSDYKAKYGL